MLKVSFAFESAAPDGFAEQKPILTTKLVSALLSRLKVQQLRKKQGYGKEEGITRKNVTAQRNHPPRRIQARKTQRRADRNVPSQHFQTFVEAASCRFMRRTAASTTFLRISQWCS